MLKFAALLLSTALVNAGLNLRGRGENSKAGTSYGGGGEDVSASTLEKTMNRSRRLKKRAECPLSHPHAYAWGAKCCDELPINGQCDTHWTWCEEARSCKSASEIKQFAAKIRREGVLDGSSRVLWDTVKERLASGECRCDAAPGKRCIKVRNQKNVLKCVLDNDNVDVYLFLKHTCDLHNQFSDLYSCKRGKEVPCFGQPCALSNDNPHVCVVRPIIEITADERRNGSREIQFTGKYVDDSYTRSHIISNPSQPPRV